MAESLDFGCDSVANVVCLMGEGLSNWMVSGIEDLSSFALDSSEFNPETGLWDAAITQTNTWLGLAVLVMVITAAVSISWGLITAQPQAIKRALLGALLAFPATILALFVVGQGLVVIDEISHGMVQSLMGDEGLTGRIQGLVQSADSTIELVYPWETMPMLGFPEGHPNTWDVPDLIMNNFQIEVANRGWWSTADNDFIKVESGETSYGLLVIFLAIMLLGLLFIAVSFAFRTFVLMLLIAFAPLAFVLLSSNSGGTWVRRWAAAVVAMAIAKPLMLGALVLLFNGFGSVPTIGDPTVLPLLIGVALVGLMPMAAYSLFSFIGGGEGGDNAGARMGGSAVSQARGAGRSATGGVNKFKGMAAGAGRKAVGAPSASPAKPKQSVSGGGAKPVASGGAGAKPATGSPASRPAGGTPSGAPVQAPRAPSPPSGKGGAS